MLQKLENKVTASRKSPAAALYAETTCGVIILLVGSLIVSSSTSTGKRVKVRARSLFTSSADVLIGIDRGKGLTCLIEYQEMVEQTVSKSKRPLLGLCVRLT